MLDWIVREGGAILSWWLLSTLAGIAIYPLFFRLAGALPSRGYALARTAGLMLIGFIFWILGVLGLLRNTPGGTVLVAVVLAIIGVIAYFTWRARDAETEDEGVRIIPWLRANIPLIVTTELLFVLLFFGWALVRALYPSLAGTEHPMDMAFLTASRRSATFPPNDPWLSNYAISYYHFGYIIMAMVANLSGVSNGIAYNLAIALLFGLTGIGVFGVAYDLGMGLRLRVPRAVNLRPVQQAIGVGLFAVMFVLFLGNLGLSLVEIPYHTGLASEQYMDWVDLKYREEPADCVRSGSADPAKWRCGWWWFAYARMVNDHDLQGSPIEVITENPHFSFILADLHPHVLSLPFAVLVVGLAYNLALRKRRLYPWEFLLYAIFTGGMIFLNSWDAVYLGLIIGAEGLRRLLNNGTGRFTPEDWRGIALFGVLLVLLVAVFYSPFFISFRSQASGILPNIIWGTKFHQFFLMFGPFLVILGGFLAVEAWRGGSRLNLGLALRVVGGAILLLLAAFILLIVLALINPTVGGAIGQLTNQSGGILAVIPLVIGRRIEGLITHTVLFLAIFVVIARLFAKEPTVSGEPEQTRHIITYSPATAFTLLLIGAGAVLTLAPEFVYLRDGFGTRMNTVFKLYYQAWLFWGIASAFAFFSVTTSLLPMIVEKSKSPRKLGDEGELVADDEALIGERPVPGLPRLAFLVVATVFIVLGMVYPVYAINSRALVESGRVNGINSPLTLDGGPTIAAGRDDYNVIQCLSRVARSDKDIVAEAIRPGVAYNSDYGRVSGLTGIPTLVGWDNHERQWRGETFEDFNVDYDEQGNRLGTRQDAIAKLYNTTSWDEVRAIVNRFKITYIYVGPTERRDFTPEGIAKFQQLKWICAEGDAAVYPVEVIPAQAPVVAGN
jgi:YYY domain-containing protein